MGHLEPMVRSALRLLREEGEEITVLLIADDEYKGHWMEAQARLALGSTPGSASGWAPIRAGRAWSSPRSCGGWTRAS